MKRRILYLDVIRVLAMSMIVFYHVQVQLGLRVEGYVGFPIAFTHINGINFGTIGVSLFFVLSGAALSISQEPLQLGVYCKKRFLSIYPSFWIAWVVCWAIQIIFLMEVLFLDNMHPRFRFR